MTNESLLVVHGASAEKSDVTWVKDAIKAALSGVYIGGFDLGVRERCIEGAWLVEVKQVEGEQETVAVRVLSLKEVRKEEA